MDHRRSFDEPDETIEFGGVREELISIGGLTVSRSTQPVGWRWSEHFKPLVGGQGCQAHHVGVVLSGRQGIELEDGTVIELGPGDLYDIPPGHEGWTIGEEPSVMLEWSGMRSWVGGAGRHRTLATLLFTDVVDSTGTATRLGDAAWHELLSMHFQACRDAVERFGGRQVTTTGDGILATFAATAQAVRCAIAIRGVAVEQGLAIRAGVHVGEVELAGDDVRGVTVHEAARIMAEAGADEILVSEATTMLARASDVSFEDAGEHEMKGVPDRWRLYRVRADVQPTFNGSGFRLRTESVDHLVDVRGLDVVRPDHLPERILLERRKRGHFNRMNRRTRAAFDVPSSSAIRLRAASSSASSANLTRFMSATVQRTGDASAEVDSPS